MRSQDRFPVPPLSSPWPQAAPSAPPNEQKIRQGQSISGFLVDISLCLIFLLCELGQEQLEVTWTPRLAEELTADLAPSPCYR